MALLHKVLDHGVRRETRNAVTFETFGERLEFDTRGGEAFPLLTTKRVFWRGVVEELLWFLRGSTDVRELQDKNVHIWDGNTSKEFLAANGLTESVPVNTIGSGYGFQWRSFAGDYPEKNGFDQVRYVLSELTQNPSGRRAFLSAWNPCDMGRMALVPCHISYNFYRDPDDVISCQVYLRSNDLIAGCPFNIASAALLTTIVAHLIDCRPGRVILCIGNAHIYEEHVEAAKQQLARTPPDNVPRVKILKQKPTKGNSLDAMIAWIEQLRYEDFELIDYTPLPALKVKMVP